MTRKDNLRQIAFSAKKKQAAATRATAGAFTSKQSQFQRRAEEAASMAADADREESRFAVTRPKSAAAGVGASSLGFRRVSGAGVAPRRKAVKYALAEGDESAVQTGGLLGAAVAPRAAAAEEAAAADGPKSKKERFLEVMQAAKRAKAEGQRRRDEAERETVALDEEFAGMMHLLTKRDKGAEEVEVFNRSGRPEVRALLQERAASRTASRGRRFAFGSSGLEVVDGEEARQPMTENDRKLLAKISHAPPSTPAVPEEKEPVKPPAASPPPVPEGEAEEDPFDQMLGQFRVDHRRAVPTERELTEEEKAARAAETEIVRADRGAKPLLDVEGQTGEVHRRDWFAEGGDKVYRMGESDQDEADEDADADGDAGSSGEESGSSGEESESVEESGDESGEELPAREARNREKAPKAAAEEPPALHPVDAALTALEAMCGPSTLEQAPTERDHNLASVLTELWTAAKAAPKHAGESFQALLLDAQRRVYKGRPLRGFTYAVLMAATHVFPVTDYRHAVMTPLLILLSSLTSQAPLGTAAEAARAVFLGNVLLRAVGSGTKFTSEPVTVALNVLGLALPRAVLEPAGAHRALAVAFPLMPRPADTVLPGVGADIAPLSLFVDIVPDDAAPAPERVTAAALRLLSDVASLLHGAPAIPALLGDSFLRTLAPLLAEHGGFSKGLTALLDATVHRCTAAVEAAVASRAPLQMRQFRPRPLRMYDPMLVATEESSERQLERKFKKELREDTKRVTRHVQAEATAQRRRREKDQAVDSARRLAKFNEVVGQLQQQQHIMKSADSLRAKGKSKKRGRVNEAATEKGRSAGDNDEM